MERLTEQTQQMYEENAFLYQERSHDYWSKFGLRLISEFIKRVNGTVLDLGAGPGRDGKIFRGSGLTTICFDKACAMTQFCKLKNLPTLQANFCFTLPFKDESFAGVWAYLSIIHVPKANMPDIIQEVSRVSVNKSIFGLGVKEGNFEGYKTARDGQFLNYTSYYKCEEICRLIENCGFSCIFYERFKENPESNTYLNLLFRKN